MPGSQHTGPRTLRNVLDKRARIVPSSHSASRMPNGQRKSRRACVNIERQYRNVSAPPSMSASCTCSRSIAGLGWRFGLEGWAWTCAARAGRRGEAGGVCATYTTFPGLRRRVAVRGVCGASNDAELARRPMVAALESSRARLVSGTYSHSPS